MHYSHHHTDATVHIAMPRCRPPSPTFMVATQSKIHSRLLLTVDRRARALSEMAFSFILRHTAIRAPARAASTSRSLRTLMSSAPISSAWRECVQQWQTTLALVEKGDASALCDVGWAKHKGLVPSSSSLGEMEVGGDDKAVTEAVFCYEQSAALGCRPATPQS